MTDTAPPPRAAPLDLWRVAEAFLHTLHALFGAPEDVAVQHTLTHAPYELLRSWIRCAEALLRRLLLIEAAACPAPNTRACPSPKRQRASDSIAFDHEKPETWRVSFRCFSSPAYSGGSAERRSRKAKGRVAPSDRFAISSPASGGDVSIHPTRPIAKRYEALIRVFNNPAAYARRLARKLFAQPHRIRETLRAPKQAQHRIDRYAALDRNAKFAAAGFLDSS